MQELLAAKKDPVQATGIRARAAVHKQTFSQRSRVVPNIVGYLDTSEASWSENPDSAASMFSPSVSIWEETYMDLENVCATKAPGDMMDDIKHMSSVVADDELNTPIIGNEFSFIPPGTISRDVISPAPCLNFGNVSDCWEDLYVSPSSVTNVKEDAALTEPSSVSDMCLNPIQDNSVTLPLSVESTTLKLPELTQTAQLFSYSAVPPTSVQDNSTTTNIWGRSTVTSKPDRVPEKATPAITTTSKDANIQVLGLQQIAAAAPINTPAVTGKMNTTAQKEAKRKELKLNLVSAFDIDDISTPVVFEALDADGTINLMKFIDNDDCRLSPESESDAIQYIIAQAEQEAEKQSDTTSVPNSVLHLDAISYTAEAVTAPVKVEPIASNVHAVEAENVEVWQVKEEGATPQMGLKLKILKQKKSNSKPSESKKVTSKKNQGKRAVSRRSSAANKSDDYYYDDDDDDEEYIPTKRSRTVQRRRLTSASSSSSTSRRAPSVSHVSDIEERYRELRDKNNEASRKSRLNRKAKEAQMQEQVVKLEKENQTLRIRAEELEKLVASLRQSLVEIVKNPKR